MKTALVILVLALAPLPAAKAQSAPFAPAPKVDPNRYTMGRANDICIVAASPKTVRVAIGASLDHNGPYLKSMLDSHAIGLLPAGTPVAIFTRQGKVDFIRIGGPKGPGTWAFDEGIVRR